MRIFIKKIWKVDFKGINSIFQIVENGQKKKERNKFQNFFFNFEIGHKKMSKNDFKKKVSKNENPFFLTFFLKHFFKKMLW